MDTLENLAERVRHLEMESKRNAQPTKAYSHDNSAYNRIEHGGLSGLLDDDHPQYVQTTGDETIAGAKTFSTFPVTPSAAPDANYEVANKKYVDDNAGGTGSGTDMIMVQVFT